MTKFSEPEKIIFNFILSFCILVFAFCIRDIAYAAELFFEPQTQELGVGQEFQVNLMLDPVGEEINAVATKLSFPEDLMEVVEIQDGSSILTLWVERPVLQDGKITFAGIVPGGFIGILGPYEEPKPGKLLEVIMRAKDVGQGELVLEETQVLLNDSLGTPADFQASNFKLQVSEDIEVVPIETIPDTIAPESFIPEIAQHPDMFEGKYFLVFSVADKQSGISYYEIQETRGKIKETSWQRAESPYVLKDQGLRSYIYVKAVDRKGNERIETVEPQHPVRWYENWWIWIIIILIIIVVYAVWSANNSKFKMKISK